MTVSSAVIPTSCWSIGDVNEEREISFIHKDEITGILFFTEKGTFVALDVFTSQLLRR